MPVIDKSLKVLHEYQGSSPCPEDFDEFWERALSEMNRTDSKVELVEADFQTRNAHCYDLYFTGTGGSRIHAKYVRPKEITKPVPTLLQFHGYSGNCGDWWDKLAFVNAGFAIAAMDCRGQGGLSQDLGGVKGNTHKGQIIRGLDDEPDKLLFRQIFLDTAQLAKIVMSFEEVDEELVGAFGSSQGGGLTVACAALEPRIAFAAPIHPFLSDYKRVWDMDLDVKAYAELRDYFRQFDPTHKREAEVFYRLGYIDIQNLAPRIQGEVLWGMGLMDDVCPPSTQFAAYNKINANKKLRIYPDFGHETLPGMVDEILQFFSEFVH